MFFEKFDEQINYEPSVINENKVLENSSLNQKNRKKTEFLENNQRKFGFLDNSTMFNNSVLNKSSFIKSNDFKFNEKFDKYTSSSLINNLDNLIDINENKINHLPHLNYVNEEINCNQDFSSFIPYHQKNSINDILNSPITMTDETLLKKNQTRPKIWHERPTPSIHVLHPELWAMIFKHLSVKDKGRVARTCTLFRDVVYGKSVWRGEVAKLHLKKKYSVVLPSLVQRGIKSIQVLSLQHGLKEINQQMPNLQDLILSGCFNLKDQKIIGSLNNLSSLQQLSLSMCKNISDKAIQHISENLPNLLHLDLSGCPKITNTSLSYLVMGSRQLKVLNLRSCRNISNLGIAKICGYRSSQTNIDGLQNNLFDNDIHRNHPVFIGQDQMDLDDINDDLDIDLEFEQPAIDKNYALVNLEQLVLQDCQKISDNGLRYIPLGLTKLKDLNLSFCSKISEFGLKHLSNHPCLETINLCHCNNIGDIALRYLSEANLNNLRSLDVSFCDKVNDQALGYIAQGMKELQNLSLKSCSITDNGLIKIGQNLIKLVNLNVGQCTKITDKSLIVVTENCTNLQSIDLYGCSKITPEVVDRFQQLPNLNKLNLDLKNNNGMFEEDLILETDLENDKKILEDNFNYNNFLRHAINENKSLDENNNFNNLYFLPNINYNSVKDNQLRSIVNSSVVADFVAKADAAVAVAFHHQAASSVRFDPNNIHNSSFFPFANFNLQKSFSLPPAPLNHLSNQQNHPNSLATIDPQIFMQFLPPNFNYNNCF